MQLVRPCEAYLTSYKHALARGWSPDNERGPTAAAEQLDRIEADQMIFLAALDDREAKGPPDQTSRWLLCRKVARISTMDVGW